MMPLLLEWLNTVRPVKPHADQPAMTLSPQAAEALTTQIAIWVKEHKSFKAAAIQKAVKSLIEAADKPAAHTLPENKDSTGGLPLLSPALKSGTARMGPSFDQEKFEVMLLKGMAGITIAEVKAYLELNESKTHDLYRKIAMDIRSRTYKQSHKAPEFESFFKLDLPRQIDKFKEQQAENKRIEIEEDEWAGKFVPEEMLLAIQKDKLHQQQEREKKEQRGLPPEVLGKTLEPRTVLEQPKEERIICASLPQITADVECKGIIIAQVLAKGQLTLAMSLLSEDLRAVLTGMDPLWERIKTQGRLAIVEMVSKKTNDIGDIKGAIGELNAILFALRSGSRSVNTGGKDKVLPLKPGYKLGGINTQDIDVRYLEGKKRMYMEAKYDAKTLIEKYKGSYTPKIKADVDGEKAPPYREMYAQWLEQNASALGLHTRTKPTANKPAALKQELEPPVVYLPLAISPQQARYQAMRDQLLSATTESRGLSAAIANTHDSLLLFLPNSNGSLVSNRLSKAGWTIVIGDTPLDLSQIQRLLQKVGEYCLATGISKDKAEEWAETSSTALKPADILSDTPWAVISLYVKIRRDLPGYERLIDEMPDGNYKDAAMKHYNFGHWCFTTTKLGNFEEARVKLDVARSQLSQAQDKVYEERIERDRAARYGSAYYGN